MKFVDAAILPFIRQFYHVDIEWFKNSQYVNTRRWLGVFLESELFVQIMPKYA